MSGARHYLRAVVLVGLLLSAVAGYWALGLGGVAQEASTRVPPPRDRRAEPARRGGEPEYTPPEVADSRLAAFVDRESEEFRVTSDISTRIPKAIDSGDIEAISTVLTDTKDDDTVRNEAANLLRRSGYPQLTDDLIKVLSNPEEKERFRTFCVQHLYNNYKRGGMAEKEKIVSKLRECLTDRHVKVRREALLALHRLKDEETEALARKWLHEDKEKGDAVRDLAIRIVRERNLRDELSTIRKLARDKNTVIRIAALVTLSEWRDQESRPLMEEAAKSDNVRLQRCGKLALKRLDESPLPGKPEKPEPAVETPAKPAAEKEVEGF